jgi:hypothetical protein
MNAQIKRFAASNAPTVLLKFTGVLQSVSIVLRAIPGADGVLAPLDEVLAALEQQTTADLQKVEQCSSSAIQPARTADRSVVLGVDCKPALDGGTLCAAKFEFTPDKVVLSAPSGRNTPAASIAVSTSELIRAARIAEATQPRVEVARP